MKLKAREHQGLYPIYVEATNSQAIYDFLESHDEIELISKSGNYYTMKTALKNIKKLYQNKAVIRVEDGLREMRILGDSSRIYNNVDSIHHGYAPLISKYTGKNVVVGLIDLGTDFTHPDFNLNNLGTRIIYLWDQRVDTLSPDPYTYGREWVKHQIDAGICTHYSYNSYGHGTGSAGIACGNGRVLKKYKGMAPESDIIPVSIRVDELWLQGIADGIEYVFNKADTIHKPAVVNLSVGSYEGSHDGTDIATRVIESKITKSGQVIVASAGNAGHIPQHIEVNPESDTFFTDFKYSNRIKGVFFNFWADIENVDKLVVGIREDSTDLLTEKSNTIYLNIKNTLLDSALKNGFHEDSVEIVNSNNEKRGFLRIYAQIQEDVINIQFSIDSIVDITNYWRFYITGKGGLDMWVHPSLQYTSGTVSSNIPNSGMYPVFKNYLYPDTKKSIVSGFQCSDKVITVGNYVNHYGVEDIDGNYSPIGGLPGKIASSSSHGPTRDGRMKPEVSAAGGATLAANDTLHRKASLGNPNSRKRFAKTGMYSTYGGTSIASPAVAGIVALMLEREPRLHYTDIENIIIATSKRDSFTTRYANNIYGYGKINAMQALSFPITYTCKDTGAINYDSSGMFHDSTLCVMKKYGCTDPSAENYDSTANIDNDSCNYSIPENNINDASLSRFSAYQNAENLIVQVESNTKSIVTIYDMQGKQVHSIIFINSCTIPTHNISSGVYFVELINSGIREKTKVFLK